MQIRNKATGRQAHMLMIKLAPEHFAEWVRLAGRLNIKPNPLLRRVWWNWFKPKLGMSPRPLVYVAGPLGDPSEPANAVQLNVAAAMAAGMELTRLGFAVMVPHTNAFWPDAFTFPHEEWVKIGEAWVEASEFVVRLPGKSVGADRETDRAKTLGIPVLTMEEARELAKSWNDDNEG